LSGKTERSKGSARPCPFERGSRNCLLPRRPLPPVPSSPREMRLSLSLPLSLRLALVSSFSSPFFRRHDRVSVPQRCYEYKNFVQEKKTESMGFFPILIRSPHLGTSVRPFQLPLLTRRGPPPPHVFSITGRHPEIARETYWRSARLAFFREGVSRLAISSANYSRGYAICFAENTSYRGKSRDDIGIRGISGVEIVQARVSGTVDPADIERDRTLNFHGRCSRRTARR